MKWIIILVIYFYNSSGRIDIKPTGLEFETAMECHEHRLSEGFRARLRVEYKGKNVSYVRPMCRPKEKNELYALGNGSVGLCSIASCIWQ